MASAQGTVKCFTSSFLHPVRVTFVTPSNHYTISSLTRPFLFSAGPYVTSVGGTQGSHPEVATPRSGGGFSDYFRRPLYQKDAVLKFLHDANFPYINDDLYR